LRKEINHIIFQLLIKAFYQQHAIILGLVYLVMFGAVEANHLPEYHLKLIEGAYSSAIALSLIMVIWTLYFLRVLFFLGQVMENKQNFLLQQIALLQPAMLKTVLFCIIAICLLPISTYAIAMIIWGILHAVYGKVAAILLLFIVMQILGMFYLQKKLTNVELRFVNKSWLNTGLSLPKKYPFQFYLKYVWNTQKLQWLVVKLIMVLAIGMSFSEALPGEELRFSIFFFAMLFLIHTNLIRQFIIWENTDFWHIRLLPIAYFKRWCNYLIFFIVLLTPELFLIVKTYPHHLSFEDMFGLGILCIGLLLFVFTVCIAFDNLTAEYGPVLFLVLLLTYIAALAEIILPFSCILLVSSFFIFKHTASNFELVNSKEQDSYT
jgi:hypothetical protein